MKRRLYITKPNLNELPFGFADIALFLLVFLALYSVAMVGKDTFVPFHPPYDAPKVTLDPINLPYYALRSTLRMFLALIASLAFALTYAYFAARRKSLTNVLIPLLDVLQSVPITGFLAILNLFVVRLFAGSLLGPEMVAIFAIFTGQAWNLAYSFYTSLVGIPKELEEASKIFRLSKWKRFTTIELPAGTIGLVWNGMMSFGGGWFFVALSEAVQVGGDEYPLPGLGSYAKLAISKSDYGALSWACVTMVAVIVISDQFFWRPLVVWAEKFKIEKQASEEVPTSWFYDLLKAARVPRNFRRVIRRTSDWIWKRLPYREKRPTTFDDRKPRVGFLNQDRIVGYALGGGAVLGLFTAGSFISSLGTGEVLRCLGMGLVTLLRVTVVLLLSLVIWTPVGVAIGFSPRLTRIFQPVVQFMVSFPAIFIFPFLIPFIVRTGIGINVGSIALMMLGTQWYILFNVIAGAMSVPNDLKWMAKNMRLEGWSKWKHLILPAIFPALVTGAITASGGAWNVSVASELVDQPGSGVLQATGLGAYIMQAYNEHDSKRLVLGVMLMCLFVVLINRLFWRRLYFLAETRYRLG